MFSYCLLVWKGLFINDVTEKNEIFKPPFSLCQKVLKSSLKIRRHLWTTPNGFKCVTYADMCEFELCISSVTNSNLLLITFHWNVKKLSSPFVYSLFKFVQCLKKFHIIYKFSIWLLEHHIISSKCVTSFIFNIFLNHSENSVLLFMCGYFQNFRF